ncbi:2Fe-2S iron-sulfur cluster binding domain-containing protein [Xanthomonas sp. Kuri4-1]
MQLHLSEDGESPRTHVPAELLAADPQAHLYLCGPQAFMERFAQLASAGGWAPARIHREDFGALDLGQDGDAPFEVALASSGQVVPVAADTTIAQALLAAGVEVALSCEQGMCGACLTGVVDGVPDHRDSVLSDGERAANRQLALCCSRSRTPRLTLDL